MSAVGRTYLGLLIVGAAAVLAAAPWGTGLAVFEAHWPGIFLLGSFGLLAEKLAVSFTVGGRETRSSISFIAMFVSILLYPLAVTLLLAVAIVGTSEFSFRKRTTIVARLFNLSQAILTVSVATVCFNLAGGVSGAAFSLNLPAFVALVLGFVATNFVVVSGYYAATQVKPFLNTLLQLAGAYGANVLYDLLVSPVALITALLYTQSELGAKGILLVILPLLIIRYSYAAKMQLQAANRDLLNVLIKAIETRDPYTSGHSIRVATTSRRIAQELKLRASQVADVETTALLHDIGKIDVKYAEIIGKPSTLSPAERVVIQSHATMGADLLRRLTSLSESVVAGVRHHHEWYDGSGYPDGLAGMAIPIAARIIMISDSVDAMLSDRSYRKALDLDHVRQELIRGSGTQFDPKIIQVVLATSTLEDARSLIGERATSPKTRLAGAASV